MGDTTYRVILALESTGSLAGKLNEMGGHANRTEESLKKAGEAGRKLTENIAEGFGRAGESMQRLADKAFEVSKHVAEIGIAGGVALATYGVAHLNRELEETQISLATVFQTQGFASNFETATKQAAEQVNKMKMDVKTLPGDLGQLSNIMKMIATPAAQGGASQDKIREMAGRGMLVGRILGVDQQMMSRELAQLFAGRAGSHNILGGRLGLIGEEAKKFNAESADKRVAQIEKMFNSPAMNAAAGAFANTWVAQSTTLVDNVKYLMLAPATGGLFERVKHSIIEVNEYIDKHKQQIESIASLINRRLVSAWDALEAIFKRIEPILERIGDRILRMQPAEMGEHLKHAGEAMLGMKLGGMAMSGMGTGMRMMGTIGMISMMGGSGGIGGAASGAVAALGAALPVLATAAAIAVPLVVAGAGALDILTDSTSIYHDEAIKLSEHMGGTLTDTMRKLGEASVPAANSIRRMTDKIGIEAMRELDKITSVFSFLADVTMETVAALEVFTSAMSKIRGMSRQFDTPVDIAPRIEPIAYEIGAHLIKMAPHEPLGGKGDDKAKSKTGGGGGGGGTHIQKVEIIVSGNQDPSRLARIIGDKLNQLGKNPKSSKHVPNFEGKKRGGW